MEFSPTLSGPSVARQLVYLAEHSPKFLEHLTVRNRGRTYHRFWQPGSGYDENVSDVGALHEIIGYIHQNPVRRGLVNRAEDWPWSSARAWGGLAVDESQLRVDRTLPAALEVPWTRRRSEF